MLVVCSGLFVACGDKSSLDPVHTSEVAGEIVIDKQVAGNFNDSGFAVYSYTANKGDIVTLLSTSDEGDDVRAALYLPNGTLYSENNENPGESRMPGCSSCWKIPEKGTYKVVIQGSTSDTARYTALMSRVQTKSVSAPGTTSIELPSHGTAIFEIEGDDDSSRWYSVDLGVSDDPALYDRFGHVTNCSKSCILNAGPYT